MSTDAPPYDYAPELEPADVLDAQAVREVGAPGNRNTNGHRANPHDTDAEEAVLGAILISTQARDDTFATGLAAHHFYAPHHATIYDAIVKVDSEGDLPDLITLSAHLGDSPDVQNRIINLQAGHTWEARNASAYARRVIHMARLRTVMAGALEAAEHARADNLPAAVSAIEAFIAPEDTSSHGIAHTLLGDFLANDEPDHDWVIPGLLERTDRILLTGPEGGGKALAIDTPIPTPAGFRPLADLEVGDLVFAPDGTPAAIVAATPVMDDRPCHSVEFSDGARIVADAMHLWQTETLASREATAKALRRGPTLKHGTDQRAKRRHFPEVVTTEHIRSTLTTRGGHALNHSIPTTAPIQYPDQTLPVDPYTLGAWLGDGHSDGARITCHPDDSEVLIRIAANGWTVRQTGPMLWSITGPERWGRGSLTAALRAAGVFGNKHIPEPYLRAPVADRLALIQGLMDTDGTISASGKCEFSVCSERLATDFLDLALGLGIKATMRSGPAKIDGREVGTRWRVAFYADLPVFSLQRKAARQTPRTTARHRLRYITAVEPVPSVPVRCIQVDRADGMFLAGRECIPTHNSTLLRQVAIQAAAGIHPFTHQEMAPLRVLLLDLENSERQIRRALRPLHVTAGGTADENLTVAVHPQGLDLNDPTDVATLTHLIATVQPELVVGGPIYKLVGGDPTEEQPAKAAAMTLDRLRVAYGFALALETHQPHGTGSDRPERPYGASLWKRWPEFGLHISSEGMLRHWRGARDERDWPAALVKGGEWPWTMEVSSTQLSFARICELVRQHGRRMSERELAAVTGAPKSNVHRAIEANKAKFEALCAGFEEEM